MVLILASGFLMVGGMLGFALCALFAGSALSQTNSELESAKAQVEILRTLLEEGKSSFQGLAPAPTP
ncbi:hypothetical protein D3C72_161090 [compost metagenome]